MKKLITICAVLCLMILISTSVSWASLVTPPPGAPGWWNSETGLYAYAWWSTEIVDVGAPIRPGRDESHWASNYLVRNDFKADITTTETFTLELSNVFNQDLYKQIYIYITGTTASTYGPVDTILNTDSGVFSGSKIWNMQEGTGIWSYVVSGEIHPQPEYVTLTFTVPGLTGVTNIWAAENCIPNPEPATMSLLGLGALSLIRRKK